MPGRHTAIWPGDDSQRRDIPPCAGHPPAPRRAYFFFVFFFAGPYWRRGGFLRGGPAVFSRVARLVCACLWQVWSALASFCARVRAFFVLAPPVTVMGVERPRIWVPFWPPNSV